MYDLTSFLTTISAGSASFVAILGGLIAQRVIEINNERVAIEEEINEITEQKKLLENLFTKYKTYIAEDEAISFIGKNIDKLIEEKDFQCVVDLDEISGNEDLNSLEFYWKNAQEIFEQYAEHSGEAYYSIVRIIQKNNLGISDNFVNAVCEAIKDYFIECNNHTILGQIVQPSITTGKIMGYGASVIELQRWNNEKNRLESELTFLNLRSGQLNSRMRKLEIPNELKGGFRIFAGFLIGCVLLPLVCVPFNTETYCCYVMIKILFLLVFGSGLFSVLWYIRRLLPKLKNE